MRFLVGLLALSLAFIVQSREPIRLDASSVEAAEASWKAMIDGTRGSKKQKLLEAMLKINLAGVKSPYEAVGNPELQTLGIARIKHQVAGMTADEIIEMGERVGTIKIDRSGE